MKPYEINEVLFAVLVIAILTSVWAMWAVILYGIFS